MNTIVKLSCFFIVVSMDSLLFAQSKLIDIDPISNVGLGRSKAHMVNVNGAHSCGGDGQFVQWRLEKCKASDTTCIYPADGQKHLGEFTFIPSKNVEQLGLRLISSVIGSEKLEVDDYLLENSTVVEGIEQTVNLNGVVAEDHKGKMMTTRTILYRADDKGVEMCAEADFVMV